MYAQYELVRGDMHASDILAGVIFRGPKRRRRRRRRRFIHNRKICARLHLHRSVYHTQYFFASSSLREAKKIIYQQYFIFTDRKFFRIFTDGPCFSQSHRIYVKEQREFAPYFSTIA